MAKKILIFLFSLVFFWSSLFMSGQQAPPAGKTSEDEVETAPVIIDDMVLFSVRGIKAYPAEERAKGIAQRIKQIAADSKIKTDSLVAIETATYTEIAAGDILITRVYDADAALELEGLPRQVLANVHLEKIKKAIEKYRLDRTPDRLLRSGLTTAGATVGFVVILFLFLWLFRKLMSLIKSRTKAKIVSLQAKSRDLLKAERLGNVLTAILQAIRIVFIFALVYIFLNYVLSLFPWTRLLSRHLTDYVLHPLQ
jgi:hypothetical protein